MSKLRLEKLKLKIDFVNTVFEEARTHLLQKIKTQPDYYKTVMKNLLVQGFIKLLDENVNIICKKEDYDLVTSLVEESKKIFIEMLTRESIKYKHFHLNVLVDKKYFLPDSLYNNLST
jgi:vacuolar-type H+-ATPase subunit E/Vma4